MTAAKALFMFNGATIIPVAIIGALVIAVALLVDELVNFYEGNDSLIGQLSKDYPYALQIAQGALALVTVSSAQPSKLCFWNVHNKSKPVAKAS